VLWPIDGCLAIWAQRILGHYQLVFMKILEQDIMLEARQVMLTLKNEVEVLQAHNQLTF
jgi:hypothetical protein